MVLQRVLTASVAVGDSRVAAIGPGLLLYVGIERGDGPEEIRWMAEKVASLRVFADLQGRMNLDVRDVGGEVLSVSQFTLPSRIGRGRRPDFTRAMEPDPAEALFEAFNGHLGGLCPLQKGVFGAHMRVQSENDGPVTFLLERNPVPAERPEDVSE